ncbi:hypothetical protein CDV52_09485 [Haematobacter missouriensis]|uniref:Polysaccharide pyruvyl transferase domain-containing protein n=1 Tax=Haematobacter missouriensis TaxID=366616 RepID=A0A212ARL1_9RHOB|nr:polysaccharide pyruvyl transferase family protein [Haematobacter missouriensis]OWJ84104.1 hypothetical protein CDV52_09485 [Haematobacter missouriensis]
MLANFTTLAERIRERASGRQVIFLPNSGNWGDGLIRYGAKRFFHDHGITHVEMNLGKGSGKYLLAPFLARPKKYLFVYSGGSAWGHNYRHGYDIVSLISRFTDNIIVLPTTFFYEPSRARGILFRRDQFESRDHCPRSLFCDDMALYLLARREYYDFGPPTERVGHIYRRDKESSRRFEDREGHDLSNDGNHMSNGDDFLRQIARYRKIITDRLHVGIGAAILGREVQLMSGSDFKIRAIYRTSLSHLPNIEFLD